MTWRKWKLFFATTSTFVRNQPPAAVHKSKKRPLLIRQTGASVVSCTHSLPVRSTARNHLAPMKHDLPRIKESLRIPEVWRLLGLPGVPSSACHSPFRPDRTPSFSVYDEGRKWKDFATGEGGDVIAFISHARQVDSREAVRLFLALSGERGSASLAQPAFQSIRYPSPPKGTHHPADQRIRVQIPPLHRGTDAEVEETARSRGVVPEAVRTAEHLCTLFFGQVCGFPCWVLTDAARYVAEARRIDRSPFPATVGLGERKAHTLKGSSKSWPAGVAVLQALPAFRAVMVVEGGPDYLAALHFITVCEAFDVLPVAMLGRGAGGRLDSQALALLQGRRVRIYPHADLDGGGKESAKGWAEQLYAAGCKVDFFNLDGLRRPDGLPVKDLNDAVQIEAGQSSELSHLLP